MRNQGEVRGSATHRFRRIQRKPGRREEPHLHESRCFKVALHPLGAHAVQRAPGLTNASEHGRNPGTTSVMYRNTISMAAESRPQ